ncbi:MAG: GNAT family N-acetyltransferase [Hyphomicrobiaceae bacterium]
MPAIVRLATPADQHVLYDLYCQLHPADPPWSSDTVAADAFSKVLGHETTSILICEVDGNAVSTAMLVVCPNLTRSGRPFAIIENVVTHRDYRKAGYGRKVVEQAIEIARQQGCYKVTLTTGRRDEETLRFYEGLGMRRDTRTAFETRFI